MDYIILGKTGLNVSVAGLGCGGHSRIGLSFDLGDDNAIKIIKTALELGVNFFDTAEGYSTESVLQKGLVGTKRDTIHISSKFSYMDWQTHELQSEGSLTKSLDASLKKLKTDYIDIYHLHGVLPTLYNQAVERFMPEMDKAVQAGKIRFKAISEMFGRDTSHETLQMASDSDLFDVIMVGYNMMNYSAKTTILPKTMKKGIGTLDMFAVRTALSNPTRLHEIMDELVKNGEILKDSFDNDNPLGFIIESGAAPSIMNAAYRFCRHTKGMDLILTGTSSADHLRDNIASINDGPLPTEIITKIEELFKGIDSVSAQ